MVVLCMATVHAYYIYFSCYRFPIEPKCLIPSKKGRAFKRKLSKYELKLTKYEFKLSKYEFTLLSPDFPDRFPRHLWCHAKYIKAR